MILSSEIVFLVFCLLKMSMYLKSTMIVTRIHTEHFSATDCNIMVLYCTVLCMCVHVD